ncbi:MAG: hypothetical protein J6A08_02380 [Lachnospiraceae bacterium]|nr:hypothetical protein [Lachnospiraceae bacterium]
MSVEGKAWGEKKEGFYTTGTMTAFYITSRIEEEKFIILLEDEVMNDNIFVIGVNMENRSAEDIAREAALKIIGITDQMVAKQTAEKAKKTEQEE